MKRVFVILLAIGLLVGSFVISVSATEDFPLKRDISEAFISVGRAQFCGMPVTPDVIVYLDGYPLTAGEDYIVYYENNVNMGTAAYRVVGIGSYYGSKSGSFEITNKSDSVTLHGAYNGQATGELDMEQYYYSEVIVPPGVFTGRINSTIGHYVKRHYAVYQLYRIVGEEAVLVTTVETEYGHSEKTEFVYDFSSVYEDAAEVGGEVYMLAYSWVNSEASVYSGVCMIAVPAKVSEGTSMTVEKLPLDDNFRKRYLTYYSENGALALPEWTSSDPSVASVNNGVVTLKKPGVVTITAQCGGLTDNITLVVSQQDLTLGEILDYDTGTGKTSIYYNGYLLTVGTDYTQSVSVQGDTKELTVTGCGLFAGQLLRQFDATTGEALGHTHAFKTLCSEQCISCDFIRSAPTDAHKYGTQWKKDRSGHWRACTVCGDTAEHAAHEISAEDPDSCVVCGLLNIPGDFNGDIVLDDGDALYLLRHTLFPDRYPVEKDPDTNADGTTDDSDALYLLRHTLFPTRYPLYPKED